MFNILNNGIHFQTLTFSFSAERQIELSLWTALIGCGNEYEKYISSMILKYNIFGHISSGTLCVGGILDTCIYRYYLNSYNYKESQLSTEIVNNAGISGANLDEVEGSTFKWEELTQTNEMTEKCLTTNYYGAKKTTEAFLTLLQLSNSPRIVNVSSQAGLLKNISNEWAKGVLDDADNLTEERIDEVLKEFIKDFKEGSLATKGWPTFLSAYIVSKAAMNSYTRILAKKHQNMCINSVCPGFVKTDINKNTGILTVDQGAASVVKLALLPDGSPSGLFYIRQELYAVVTRANKGIGLETVKVLDSNVIKVVLTARYEDKGHEAIERLKECGLSNLVIYHQLDVTDSASIASLVDFVKSQFGKLDILESVISDVNLDEVWEELAQTYEMAEKCLTTNYYGAKETTEASFPLLPTSNSPRIVNFSLRAGQLVVQEGQNFYLYFNPFEYDSIYLLNIGKIVL
ncbi:(+)-neomenthol dehydrogenase [Glycine max]|nr:(+)-neomenthol dehydrogenase [Glycine max]